MSDLITSAELYCPQCGYDLRAIQSDRCPECGIVIDREALGRSVIPWTHRRHIGLVRAFFKTVWMSIRRPALIARDAAYPVSYRDAQHFRWVIIFTAWVSLTAWALGLQLGNRQNLFQTISDMTEGLQMARPARIPLNFDLLICWMRCATTGWIFTPLLILLMLIALTGVGSYFFHPRGLDVTRQNRAITLSYYACGPLAYLIMPVSFLGLTCLKGLGMAPEPVGGRFPIYDLYLLYSLLLLLSFPAMVLLLALWLSATLRISKGATTASIERVAGTALMLPVLWLTIAAVFLVVIPIILGLLMLMVQSYWA